MSDETMSTSEGEEDEVESADERRLREFLDKNPDPSALAVWGFLARLAVVLIACHIAGRLFDNAIHRLPLWYQPAVVTLVLALTTVYELWRKLRRAPAGESNFWTWRFLGPLVVLWVVGGAAIWAFSLLWDRLMAIGWLAALFGGLIIAWVVVRVVWLLVDERRYGAERPESED